MPDYQEALKPYEKIVGKRGVRIDVRGEWVDLLTMRNGYQWSGSPVDRELLLMVRKAIDAALGDVGEAQPGAVYVKLIRPEGYEDVHPELLLQDAKIDPAFEPEIVTVLLKGKP